MHRTRNVPTARESDRTDHTGFARWRGPISRLRTGLFGKERALLDEPPAIYEKIDSSKEIRLLTIAAEPQSVAQTHEPYEKLEAPIICTLTAEIRSAGLIYRALSYTWGDVEAPVEKSCDSTCVLCEGREDQTCLYRLRDTSYITCNGSALAVTTNCYNALLTLRNCKIYGPLWIDAICINQRDIRERSAQVARIGEIFNQAKETIVCLCHEQLGLTAPVEPLPALRYYPGQETPFTKIYRREFGYGSIGNKESDTSLLTPEMFYRSPWFTRTWIIQEVILSQRLIVVPELGHQSLPWEILGSAYREWDQDCLSWQVPDIVKIKRSARWDFDSVMRGLNAYTPISPQLGAGMHYQRLFEVLEKTRHFQCKDPRDKLFAILPLFKQPSPHDLAADYSKTVVDVFLDLTWFLLRSEQCKVLSLASLHADMPNKPSWVVDWSDPAPQASRLKQVWGSPKWTAGLWPYAERMMCIRQKSKNVLIVRGRIVQGDATAYGRKLQTRQYPAQANDKLCVLLGFRPLFLLRPFGTAFRLVDECAIDGFMRGEALLGFKPGEAYAPEPPSGMLDFEIH